MGFVYAVHAVGTDRIKIGYSVDPEQRLNKLQTGSPIELELVAKWKGTDQDERELHRILAEFRAQGEWFRLSPQETRQRVDGYFRAIEQSSLTALLTMLQSQLSEIKSAGANVRLFQRSDGVGILLTGVNFCPRHQIIHSGTTCPIC
jgi:hypothetical protein